MTLRELLAASTAAHRRAVADALGLEVTAPAARIAASLADVGRLATIVAGLSPAGRAAATAGAFAGPGASFTASVHADATGVQELERNGLAYAFGRAWRREYRLPDDLLAPLQQVRGTAHAARIADGPVEAARFVGAPLQIAQDAAVLRAFMAREPLRVKADGELYARTRPKLEAALPPIVALDDLAGFRVDLALGWLSQEGFLRLRVDDLGGRDVRRELVPAGDAAVVLSLEVPALRERLATGLAEYDELRCALALMRALRGRELPLAVFGEALCALLEEAQFVGHQAFDATKLAITCVVPLWLAGEIELGLDARGAPVAARMHPPGAPAGGDGPLGVAQSNFELVLLRTPTPAERLVLELCCERTAGQAHVFRITREAAHAAERAGAGPGGVAGALSGLAGELPQNVERSLRDWTRTVRPPLRLRSALLVDAGDAASAEALATGALADLVIERVGDRMLAVPAARLDDVRRALKRAGSDLEPGLERISGTWEDRSDTEDRARQRWEPTPAQEHGPAGEQVSTIATGTPGEGDLGLVSRPASPEMGADDPAEPLATILAALERDVDIAIVYADARGVTHEIVTPLDVDEFTLRAHCHRRDREHSFVLDAILAIAYAGD